MAYISQQEKKEIAPVVKGILKEYGLKGTLGIDNHSSLVLKIKDTIGMFADKFAEDEFTAKWGLNVNEYWIEDHYGADPVRVEMLNKVVDAMKAILDTEIGNIKQDLVSLGVPLCPSVSLDVRMCPWMSLGVL